MNIVNVFTKKQKVIANAHLAANSDYIVYENSILTNCKISRNIFRNLAINQLIISDDPNLNFAKTTHSGHFFRERK